MKKQPIFTKILIPLMGLVILEILILMISIYGQGLFSLIHKNSQDIIESRVEARRNYLESLMVNQWMGLWMRERWTLRLLMTVPKMPLLS